MKYFWLPGRRSRKRAERELAEQLLAKQDARRQLRTKLDISMSPWGARALSRIDYLYAQNEIEKCKPGSHPQEECTREALIDGIHIHLDTARKVVKELERRRIRIPCTDVTVPVLRRPYTQGRSLETIWSHLRAADVAMLELVSKEDLASRSGEVLSMAQAHLRRDHPEREELTRRIEKIKTGDVSRIDRGVLIHTLDAAYGALDAEISRVRSLRDMLWLASGVVFAGVACLAAIGWKFPDAFHLCFTNGTVCPSSNDSAGILYVEMAGLCGAALTFIVSLGHMGTSKPYGLPLAAAVLKFPTGALTAFLGLLFARGGFIPGLSHFSDRAQLLGWAAIFGAAQHLVTRLVDTRAREALSDVSLEPGTGHGNTG
ncbi:hypothetical protein ACF082_29875 [Streptomyces lydicus]|uniref:hypothetical protein n=1 Tax=Streptomyces lydicus TaxID=47763 RepID=UPI0036FF9FBA